MGLEQQFSDVLSESELGLLDGDIPIIVQHENGDQETLHLKAPITIKKGKHLNTLTDGSGYDYYFTKEGFCNGWGKSL